MPPLRPSQVQSAVDEVRGTTSGPGVVTDGVDPILEAYNAEALAVGRHILARPDTPERVLDHERVHVAQHLLPGPPAPMAQLEAEAHRLGATGRPEQARLAAPDGAVLRHPAIKVLLRAGNWLGKRATKTLSKHVARHGRRIAGRAIHSVFKSPKKIKSLVTSAVDDAAKLAKKFPKAPAGEVLEEGGVRIIRQTTRSPGKYRYVVEKEFGKVIGTRGETVLRVVLDMSGRVVTAFPTRGFLSTLGAVAVSSFTANTAEAASEARQIIEADANRSTNWGEEALLFSLDILSFGLLASSPVNEGEDTRVALDNLVWRAAQETIAEIEAMPVDEMMELLAYFEMRDSEREKDRADASQKSRI